MFGFARRRHYDCDVQEVDLLLPLTAGNREAISASCV